MDTSLGFECGDESTRSPSGRRLVSSDCDARASRSTSPSPSPTSPSHRARRRVDFSYALPFPFRALAPSPTPTRARNFHHPPRAPRRVQIPIDDERRRLTTARDIPTSTRARTRVKNFVQRARAARVRLTRSRAARWRAHRERSFVTTFLEILFRARPRTRRLGAARGSSDDGYSSREGAVRNQVTPRSAPRSAKRRRRRRKSRRRTRTPRVVRKKWRDRRSTRSRR